MFLKSIPYIFLFLLLSSCAIQKKEVNLTENKIIDTDGFFDSYFGGYPILFKETTFKPEAYNKIFL